MITSDDFNRMAGDAALYSATLTLANGGLMIKMVSNITHMIPYVELTNSRFPCETVQYHLQDMHEKLGATRDPKHLQDILTWREGLRKAIQHAWDHSKDGFEIDTMTDAVISFLTVQVHLINKVDASIAKQLELSIARNSRLVSRLTALLPKVPAAGESNVPGNLRCDITRIINDQDPE
jgi:hypothetical protein